MATTLTKPIGTVTLTGAAEKITLPAVYGWVWVKNMSEGDIFAGLSEDISEGADGVMTIPAGDVGRIQADSSREIYLLGTGNVQIVGQNYADCPFKAGGKGGELPVASTDTLGGVMVDGTSITADENGVISAVGGDNWTYIGNTAVSSASGSGWVDLSIPNLSHYKFIMLSICTPGRASSQNYSYNYTRIFILDDMIWSSGYENTQYFIGDDINTYSSSQSSKNDIGRMDVYKSLNKISFLATSSFRANIYVK